MTRGAASLALAAVVALVSGGTSACAVVGRGSGLDCDRGLTVHAVLDRFRGPTTGDATAEEAAGRTWTDALAHNGALGAPIQVATERQVTVRLVYRDASGAVVAVVTATRSAPGWNSDEADYC